MANPLMAILAIALVTTAGAGLVMHAVSSSDNAARGEACGHEFDKDHGHAGNWTHDESREHDATSNHTNNAVCDRDDNDVDDHGGAEDHGHDDDMNETENETFS